MVLVSYLVALALPFVGLGLWMQRKRARERLGPGEDGLWRGGLLVPSYGLRVEPGAAWLRVVPPAAQPFLGLLLLLIAWTALGPRLLSPLFVEEALPEPLASFVRRQLSLSASTWVVVGLWVLGGVVNLASCLEQTELFVERGGDLRVTRRSWRGAHEVSYPRAAFAGLMLGGNGRVLLLVKGFDPTPSAVSLFGTSRLMDREQVRADVARADEAFRAGAAAAG